MALWALSAPRPHQQAHNAIQDFVMAAYTASVAGIEAPPLKPTSQQLASYAGQLGDVFALAFMQILDIGGTTAFLKKDAGEYDCEGAQLDTPPPINHIWGRPPQMHCATKQIKITSACMMYHPFMLMYNTTYSPNSTWEKAHTKHIISPHPPTQPWYKAPHLGTVTNTYFTPPPPTMAVPPTAATLGRKYDPNAFIMQPNNTIMNDILDDTGGVITLRYRDENLGTTVMELTLSQLPPAASATNSDDMDTNLTSILILNTSTHIILSPIVNNTSVTGTQLMNALRTVMNLAQRMMDGSAGSQTDMLPPFSVRDRLTQTVTIEDLDTRNPNDLFFTLDKDYKGKPISAVPEAKRGSLRSYVIVTADRTFSVMGIASLSLLASTAMPRHVHDALLMFSVSPSYPATILKGRSRPPPLRPDHLARKQGKVAATQGAMAALHTATDLWNGMQTLNPNNPTATMASFKTTAAEATNNIIMNIPPLDLRPVVEDEEELDIMELMFGDTLMDEGVHDPPAPAATGPHAPAPGAGPQAPAPGSDPQAPAPGAGPQAHDPGPQAHDPGAGPQAHDPGADPQAPAPGAGDSLPDNPSLRDLATTTLYGQYGEKGGDKRDGTPPPGTPLPRGERHYDIQYLYNIYYYPHRP